MKLAEPFHIIAHRGASGYAPENTMAAFRRAVDMGATEVETDVGFTRDGRLLLLHDDTLDRTTNGRGKPEHFTWEELQQLDAGSWQDPRLSWDRDYRGEKLICLDHLLDEFGSSLTYHIEVKLPTPGLPEAVVDLLQQRDLSDKAFLFSIEDEAGLKRASQLEPRLRIAWAPEHLLRDNPQQAIEQCVANGFTMITLNSSNQTRQLVELAHARGLEARSSGIANKEKMIAAAELGCNGMTINWPDWLIDYARNTH